MILYQYFKWKKNFNSYNEKSLIFFAFYYVSDYNMYVYVLYIIMKKTYRLVAILLWISMIIILPTHVYGQEWDDSYTVSHNNSIFNQSSINVLKSFYTISNKKSSDRVQRTDLDNVSSRGCTEAIGGVGISFTITRTLCNIKGNIWDYLQYIMYIWLSVATILLIRNGFKLVTSSDREKQMSTFKKNLIYIIIWVILLVAFYYIIDVFVSLVNLIEK